ncbi:EF hand [Opisthorchis viverrini]|uniref:Uncharacterized protein n=2 Tax=Opisthorchis viverrini TaxID=6198 RepID=A0A074ZEV7_OPIVI|nr:hypothetical protein T265_06886 [Opisthorchis viverrini]KER25713.1 hypothetical protein T265_06886 [Opisthorchis viverrini]OON20308.1 EF hand [Opisthorchis viverrini]
MQFSSDLSAFGKILVQEFDALDKKRDRKLCLDELKSFLTTFGFKESQAVLFMKLFDKDKDGFISKEEFSAAVKKIKPNRISEAQLRQLFKKADKKNCGKLDAKELRACLLQHDKTLDTNHVDEWIRKHDKNKDGKLNYEEFITFMLDVL